MGVRTLPVILGEARARRVARLADDRLLPDRRSARSLVGWIGPWVLLVVLGIPRLVDGAATCSRRPKPAEPPPATRSVGWPLWFVGYAFIHTRRAGGLLTLGLLLNALLPVTLPWL